MSYLRQTAMTYARPAAVVIAASSMLLSRVHNKSIDDSGDPVSQMKALVVASDKWYIRDERYLKSYVAHWGPKLKSDQLAVEKFCKLWLNMMSVLLDVVYSCDEGYVL